ncbi:GAF and ANTAR domain-containing protein [Tsukamurella soli]|uniref:GAF and ANTAR domain-containing protein n=1 Tax=Tsukamurella soli TaxID=644556 RepID=A0ABP8K2X0_9ACTN
MYDVHTFAAELTRFNRSAAAVDGDERILIELTESVSRLLGIAGAGVCLSVDGRLQYAAACTEQAAVLERCQVRFQSGPCCDALGTAGVHAVADVWRYEVRWPSYAAAARRVGITGVAAIAMQFGSEPIGVLDLYTVERHDWTRDELGVAQVLAELAAANVIAARARVEQRRLTDQLQHALDARVVVEQAKGILANRHGIAMEQAFELIRRHARGHHLTAREVATDVVERRLRL